MTTLKTIEEYKEFVVERLNQRILTYPQLKPRVSCSSWYFPKIFGTDNSPEMIALAVKALVNEGKLIEAKDDHGWPSFILVQNPSNE